jgi:hypothetical protein
MPGGTQVTVDITDLVAGMRRLDVGLKADAQTVGKAMADNVAQDVRQETPVLTGRLRSSVTTNTIPFGAETHYGTDVPYAGKIERRNHMVEDALNGAPEKFLAAITAAAELVVRSL